MNPHENEKKTLTPREHIRARPAMYFGRGGPGALPDILTAITTGVLNECGIHENAQAVLKFAGANCERISMEFSGLVKLPLIAVHPERWIGHEPFPYILNILAAVSQKCRVSLADRNNVEVLNFDDFSHKKTQKKRTRLTPDLSLQFTFYQPTFGTLAPQDFHRLAGILRDQAVLRRGLAIRLERQKPDVLCAWQYPQGLSSYVSELDHSRWPLHAGQICVSEQKGDMKLDFCLRFVHAGVSQIQNWVNFEPTHGGAHLEGLGDALSEVFPDANKGCRVSRFVTNPDTNAYVKLPHTFVAVLHLQMKDPHFAGPTKDILMGDDVREFVREACRASIGIQWKELRDRRM